MNKLVPPASLEGARIEDGTGIRVDTVSRLAGFLALRREWTELFQRAANPQQVFQSFEFLELWARHYLRSDARLHIVVARQMGHVVAIVPLMRERRFGLDCLRFMGTPVAQFDDAIIAPCAAGPLFDAVRAAIETSGADLLEARRVRQDAALHKVLPKTATTTESLKAPFANLQTRVGGEGPGDAYSARDRSNHRRRLRRLAELGAVSARAVWPGGEAAELAATAIDMKRDWLNGRGIASPTVTDPRFRDFFVDAASDQNSPLRISSIDVAGKSVAIDLSFDCKGRTFGHVIATDPAFDREGVGQILIHHVFGMAKARGNATFDLMAPLDEYKLRHSDGMTQVDSLVLPLSRRARLLAPLIFKHILPAAKSLARRLPPGLVRRIVG